MRWTKMNYRHDGWRAGYRYFVQWTGYQGMWRAGVGEINRWLRDYYGPTRIEIHGPPSREQMERQRHWSVFSLGWHRNPHWDLDTNKRRLYITEEALMWARLLGKCD